MFVKDIGLWKWKLLSLVQLFVTPWTIQSMEFSRPVGSLSLLQGIEPRSPALQPDSLPAEPQEKPKNTGVVSLSLLQQIFPTQGSNPGLLHCSQILYQLSHKGSPRILEWLAIFLQWIFLTQESTRVSCIAVGFFTNWAIRELLYGCLLEKHIEHGIVLPKPLPTQWLS